MGRRKRPTDQNYSNLEGIEAPVLDAHDSSTSWTVGETGGLASHLRAEISQDPMKEGLGASVCGEYESKRAWSSRITPRGQSHNAHLTHTAVAPGSPHTVQLGTLPSTRFVQHARRSISGHADMQVQQCQLPKWTGATSQIAESLGAV